MLWQPINLSSSCPSASNLTACSPFGYVYLDLLVRLFGRSKEKYPCTRDYETEEYDFVVVGAGSAGCIVANRLSAFGNWRVLLLEAGSEEPDITQAPSLEYVTLGTNIDWQYETQPDGRSCLSRIGQKCPWPRGKTMGGSSAINSLSYVRGNELDYDTWATMGNPGWSYKEVLPYFKKSEHNMNIENLSRKYHGTNGEQPISALPYVDNPSKLFIHGINELGLPIADFNGEHQTAIYNSQSFAYRGERVSTNKAFIQPIRSIRRNLVVKTNAEATKILINNKKVAYGVKYLRNGRKLTAIAKKEVIICGGSINSPKLLMLSGIGHKKHLEEAGIKVIQDLPVGDNLHDHVTFNSFVMALPNNTLVSNDKILEDIIEYYRGKRDNPIAADGIGKVVGFIKTTKDAPAPDVQYQFQSFRINEFKADSIQYNAVNILPASYYNGIGIRVTNLIPKSRGFMRLNITHPSDKPIIHANYLHNSEDFDPLIRGSKIIFNLEKTKAFRNAGVKFDRTPFDACKDFEWGSDGYIVCMAKHYTDTTYHPVGTCKMGPATDAGAVVDSKLRVHGIRSLRVMDSSAIPVIIRGNTNAPAMLMGERGVDFVIDYWYRKLY